MTKHARTTTRRTALLVAAGLLGLPAAAQSPAAAWPTQPVRIVVGFGTGGDADTTARILAEGLAKRLGKPVLVENRPGAGGTIAAAAVAKAEGDGHTLLLGSSSDQVNAPALYSKLAYAPDKDFAPISMVVVGPMMLVTAKASPFSDVAGLVAYARANPGKVSFASAGAGTASHLAGELLQQTVQVPMVHVPYKGNGPAITDLLGGHVSLMFSSPVSALAHVRDGGMKALAVTSAQRLPGSPATPTFAEAGLPAVDVNTVLALVGPATLPRPLVNRIASEVRAVIAVPDIASRIRATGADPVGLAPAETAAQLDRERAKWAGVIKAAKISLD